MGTNYHEIGKGYKRGDSKLLDRLKPKNIILDAIRSRLEGTGITKLILIFNTQTDKYNIMLSKDDGGSIKLDIEKDDITKIKKVFINRIYKKYQEQYNKDIKAIIIEINLTIDELKVLTQDLKDNVELFDYKLI
jgi:hypothetical protein